MNDLQSLSESPAGPSVALFLLFAGAFWCWIGSGPLCLRWPLIVLIVLMTSGHSLGALISCYLGALSGPILVLLITLAGIRIMIFGFGRRPRRDHYYDHDRHASRWGRRW